MSCHSFLHTVRYGNIIIGVYIGGSGSTELFCVRAARKARAGSDEKHQHPVPLSGPQEWHGMPGRLPWQADGVEHRGDWDKEYLVKNCYCSESVVSFILMHYFQVVLGPIFFLHIHLTGSLQMCEIPPLLL